MRSAPGAELVEELSEETITIAREQVDEAAFTEAWEQGRRCHRRRP